MDTCPHYTEEEKTFVTSCFICNNDMDFIPVNPEPVCTACGINCAKDDCIFDRYLFALVLTEQKVGAINDSLWYHSDVVYALRGFPQDINQSFTFLIMINTRENHRHLLDYETHFCPDKEAIITFLSCIVRMSEFVHKGTFPRGFDSNDELYNFLDI